jgi:protein involved in polysaccharide export with SLBB domain
MKVKIFLFLLLFTLSFAPLLAQSLAEIQNVKVDNLSDAQIQEFIKRAEASGMNEQQLIAMARDRGMPASEIAKLQARVKGLQNKELDDSSFGSADTGREGISEDITVVERGPDSTEQQSKIFGFSVFRNNKLSFTPNLNVPTPINYVLGADDQLLVDVYGASQQRYDLRINNEGMIFVPNIGPINLGGLTVEAATARLKNTLSNIFSGLSGSSPSSFLQLRLGNIRSIQVAMIGEVFAPGNYTLSSFSTVFNALYASGGVTENGSMRAIKVYRSNRLVAEVDVYDFLVNADQSKNIRLQDNDVIMVPPVEKRVEIQGPLRRPGLFEIVQDESLEDLIKFAGGFNGMAYPSRAIVYRTTDKELKIENIENNDYASFRPRQGDNFIFGEILTRYENRVQVTGALMRPGTFGLLEGMKINDLIKKAEGLREDAFLNRATLYRTKPDFSLEIVAVNIGAIVRGEEQDIVLQREDVLNIPSIYDLQEEYYVKITGEINNPGAFAFGANMRVSDLVLKAGGFTEAAMATQIEVVRRVRDDVSGKLAEIIQVSIDKDLKMTAAGSDLQLMPFDHVLIRRSPGYQREKLVRVEGEVYYPGEYALATANERISDLLKRSGGLNQFAFAKGATLIRRNEFYVSPLENAITMDNLAGVKSNATQDEKNNTESEKILLSRIDSKISQKALSKDGATETVKADNFKKETIENMAQKVQFGNQASLRSEEMVGIDLEAILLNPGGDEDLILKEGDLISIPKELQTVRMRGEILNPTSTKYQPGKSFNYYVGRAGGFTLMAKKNRSYVIYPNGDLARTKSIFIFSKFPKVLPGSELIIPSNLVERRFDPIGIITSVTGIITSGVTFYLLLNNLGNNTGN